MYDVIIVGAGPAGLFAAYQLILGDSKLKILLLDKGKLANKRYCPMNKDKTACLNCNPCQILSGFGGAGTFSDGKLNFVPKIGKSDLFKYMSSEQAYGLIDEAETIFNRFGMDAPVYPSNMDKAYEIQKEVAKKGARLLIIKNKHIGSDKLPACIQKFTDFLLSHGVDIKENMDVLDLRKTESNYEVKCAKKTFTGKKVIIAPGRTGSKWAQALADQFKIPYLSQSIEIGVRVEVRKEIMVDLTNIIYDPTIFIRTDTYGDEVRTFCVNPGGYVAKENYHGYICVNGYANKEVKSNNSNFAFISKVTLTSPTTNTREYGESIANIANVLGVGKPIVQTLKDLRKGRRSEWHKINKGYLEPTLKDCIAGDLALALPHRIIVNILEGLQKLDGIIPGVNNDETLLYGPEIKFFSNEMETDNNFKVKDENIYFVGDGAGKAGNIVVAAVTGLVAANDILKNNSCTK